MGPECPALCTVVEADRMGNRMLTEKEKTLFPHFISVKKGESFSTSPEKNSWGPSLLRSPGTSLPDGCLCPGDLGVGRPYHRAGCRRLPAERPERSSLRQVPSASPTLSVAPGNRGKCRLCRCPWPHFPESTEGILDTAFRGSKAACLFQAPPLAGRGPMEMEEGLGVRI